MSQNLFRRIAGSTSDRPQPPENVAERGRRHAERAEPSLNSTLDSYEVEEIDARRAAKILAEIRREAN